MLSTYRFKIRYCPKSSEQLGRLVGIQRYAHNWAISLLADNNKLTYNQLSKLWTVHRHSKKWLDIHDRYVQTSGIEKAFHAFRAHLKWKYKARKRQSEQYLRTVKQSAKKISLKT